jgi:hypothetical protein
MTSSDRLFRKFLALFSEFLLLLISESRPSLSQQNLQRGAGAAYDAVTDSASQESRKRGKLLIKPLAERFTARDRGRDGPIVNLFLSPALRLFFYFPCGLLAFLPQIDRWLWRRWRLRRLDGPDCDKDFHAAISRSAVLGSIVRYRL